MSIVSARIHIQKIRANRSKKKRNNRFLKCFRHKIHKIKTIFHFPNKLQTNNMKTNPQFWIYLKSNHQWTNPISQKILPIELKDQAHTKKLDPCLLLTPSKHKFRPQKEKIKFINFLRKSKILKNLCSGNQKYNQERAFIDNLPTYSRI